MCTLGSDCVRSPLPSLVTITVEPVSAIMKLAPVMPTSAARNFSRRIWRASATSCEGSISCRSAGSLVCRRRKSASTWSWVRWMAGAMIWLGVSWRIWIRYSPRSVSATTMPSASSASLRPISSEIIDLPLVTTRARASRQILRTIRRASSAVGAKCTVLPASVAFFSNASR